MHSSMKTSIDTVAIKVSTEKRTMPKMSNSEKHKKKHSLVHRVGK